MTGSLYELIIYWNDGNHDVHENLSYTEAISMRCAYDNHKLVEEVELIRCYDKAIAKQSNKNKKIRWGSKAA